MRLRKCAGCRKPEATHTIAHNKGDLLVELDKEPYQVKVDIARAQVGVAKSNLIGAQAKDRQRVGHHQLPGSQCDHPADVRLAGDATRQAELLPGLDRGIHHCLCDVRNGLVLSIASCVTANESAVAWYLISPRPSATYPDEDMNSPLSSWERIALFTSKVPRVILAPDAADARGGT